MKFTEFQLEQAFIELLAEQDILHLKGEEIERTPEDVLIKSDLRNYLSTRYQTDNITTEEIDRIIKDLESYSELDLYESNKAIMKKVADGFIFKRSDRSQKDLFIELIDYSEHDNNTYRIVNQLEIHGTEKRIPDGIIYINGLPLVVIEFKTAIREETNKEASHRKVEELLFNLKSNILILNNLINNALDTSSHKKSHHSRHESVSSL